MSATNGTAKLLLSFKNNLLQKLSIATSALLLGACAGLAPDGTAGRDARAVEKAQEPAELAVQYYTSVDELLCSPSLLPPEAEPPAFEANTVWQRIRAGYQLDWRQQHPRIAAQFNWYSRHPEYMLRVSERAKRYLYHVVETVERRGLPGELALLPIVESAYDPFAYSHGRASGMWQFIPGTARYVGLKHSWWYDGRRDVIASTDAALDYLEGLYQRLDEDWLLALAAYNSGEGTVRKAQRRNKARGKPTDFWSLDLPRETRAYVPKLLALAQLVHAPARYGVALHPVPNEPYFQAVATGSQIDLAQAAQLAGVEIEEIYRLNPGFNRWATDPDGPHRLLVPAAHAERFATALQELPAQARVSWQRYQVKPGDSLIRIARRFNTDVAVIKQTNKLRSNTIRAGQGLLIPVASRDSNHYALSAAQRLEQLQNTPRGDKQLQYTVQSGDSFWSISRRHGVGVRELAKWNGMAPGDTLRPGKELVIWVDKAAASAPTTLAQRDPVIRKVGYTVRNGDSLARIASKFNLQVRDILKWNAINPKHYLQPGQYLTLYVDVTRGVN